jgi:hypothetical protein
MSPYWSTGLFASPLHDARNEHAMIANRYLVPPDLMVTSLKKAVEGRVIDFTDPRILPSEWSSSKNLTAGNCS